MKDNLTYVVLLAVVVLIGYVLMGSKESFVPEFLEQGNVKATSGNRQSSYDQKTNHFVMTPSKPEPVAGVETPFRVNMHNSFMT
jgi:flagellar basal body-associated protein FliL